MPVLPSLMLRHEKRNGCLGSLKWFDAIFNNTAFLLLSVCFKQSIEKNSLTRCRCCYASSFDGVLFQQSMLHGRTVFKRKKEGGGK